MRLCWIDVYYGPPDVVTLDVGKQFLAKVSRTNDELLHIETRFVASDSPDSLSYFEQTHSPVCHEYSIIGTEASDPDAETALEMVVSFFSYSTGHTI